MEIKRSGSQPSGKGQPEYFTGPERYSQIRLPKPRSAAGRRGALGVGQAHSTINLFELSRSRS
jgi:hypothetical protein